MVAKETEKIKILHKILNHFKTHWKKWCCFVLCVSLGMSGYTCENKFFTCNKTTPKIEGTGIKKTIHKNIQK
jgi:hypothetical protein